MQSLQDLFLTIISIQSLVLLILFYFFILKPNHHAKRINEQKAKENRAAQRQVDIILSEYPTISRYINDECFSETELGYRPMETKGR